MAETAPRCRLYLVLPASPPPAIERSLTEALDTTDVACLLASAVATADPALDARLRELTAALGLNFEKFRFDDRHDRSNCSGCAQFHTLAKSLAESADGGDR